MCSLLTKPLYASVMVDHSMASFMPLKDWFLTACILLQVTKDDNGDSSKSSVLEEFATKVAKLAASGSSSPSSTKAIDADGEDSSSSAAATGNDAAAQEIHSVDKERQESKPAAAAPTAAQTKPETTKAPRVDGPTQTGEAAPATTARVDPAAAQPDAATSSPPDGECKTLWRFGCIVVERVAKVKLGEGSREVETAPRQPVRRLRMHYKCMGRPFKAKLPHPTRSLAKSCVRARSHVAHVSSTGLMPKNPRGAGLRLWAVEEGTASCYPRRSTPPM